LVLIGKVEGNDVGIKIVIQPLPVDAQHIFVGAKNVIQFGQGSALSLKKKRQEFPQPRPVQ
jgi:hypothetical protein